MTIRRWTVAAALGTALLAGCTSTGSEAPASSAAPLTAATAPSTPGGIPDLTSPEELAQGIDVPWGLAFLPGGDALVAERNTGRVLRLGPGGGDVQPVRTISDITAVREGGLLGLAVSPSFADDDMVYAFITTPRDNRIVRFPLSSSTTEPEVIFSGIDRGSVHNGGRIAFGPDGMLYAGTGDAFASSQSQDPSSFNGKILRMTPDGEPAPGNPTPGSPVYSLGHRNVQGLAWDEQGRMFAAEFGQDEVDEVNAIQAGGNYGWPLVEGTGDTQDGRYTNPIVTWRPSEASPSGLAIAGDTAYVAALRGQRLWTVPLDAARAGEPVARLEGQYGRLRTVQVAPDGALWVTTSNTDDHIAPRADDDRVLRFPAR